MTITLEIPEQLAVLLGKSGQELSRHALESVVLQGYREERITGPAAAEILGMSRLRWEQFLDGHHVLEDTPTVDDFEKDVATLQRLRLAGLLRPV